MDKREAIILRLMDIIGSAQAGAGILTVVRNREALKNEKRPAAVVLDADERLAIVPGTTEADIYRGLRPSLVRMQPEIYIILKEARPTGAAEAPDDQNIGTLLNEKRIKLSNAITNDATLQSLVGENGTISYQGCVTDLKSGSALTGQMRLDFAFNYIFDPTAS